MFQADEVAARCRRVASTVSRSSAYAILRSLASLQPDTLHAARPLSLPRCGAGSGAQMMKLVIGDLPLTSAQMEAVLFGEARVELSHDTARRVDRSSDIVARAARSGQSVYGVTTGFGSNRDTSISPTTQSSYSTDSWSPMPAVSVTRCQRPSYVA